MTTMDYEPATLKNRLQEVNREIRDKQREKAELIEAIWPVDSFVCWRHGDHMRSGRVAGHEHVPWTDDHYLTVESDASGKHVSVSVSRVEAANG